MTRRGMDTVERVMSQVEYRGRCWLFTGPKDECGYGRIKVAGRSVRTHRLMYEWVWGALKPGQVVCHACDTPNCINPAHLGAGTQQQNIADAVAKGRMKGRGSWTKCPRGHEYTEDNIIRRSNGTKLCKTCRQAWWTKQKERAA